jgi:DNA-binding LacI/PurR family transcriptional regulator
MASMKDVAKIAGVSVSTVSRVISGRIPVDEVTAERVREAINELDFRPNLLASGLRSKSSKLIGLVVPGIYEPFASIVDHLEYFAANHGYSLLVGNSRSLPDVEERFVDSLIRRHVDGIIFTPIAFETPVMSHLLDSDIPIVWFDRVSEDRRVLSVRLDNEQAGRIAAEHLIENGHRRIAVVTGPENVDLTHVRLRGFLTAASRHGISIPTEWIFEGDFSFNSGFKIAGEIASLATTPTAVWAQNDLTAIGLLKGFAAAGLAVPEQISIIGMDGIPLTGMVHPELTTVAQPIETMCRTAISKVLEYQKYLQQNQLHTVFQTTLIQRGSVQTLEEVQLNV